MTAPTVTIRFEQVGRERLTWTHRFLALPPGEAGEVLIAREARSALGTTDVCAVWDLQAERGVIYAGSSRAGRFTRLKTEPPAKGDALWL